MKIQSALQMAARPAAWLALARDALSLHSRIQNDETHLRAAMDWLRRAHDNGQGGVALGWSLKTGWQPPYPETSGYIIPTFLNYAKKYNAPEFTERALKIGEWELSLQFESGAFPSSAGTGGIPLVFDAAQILQGLLALFTFTQDEKWLAAATRAGAWIISLQQPNGAWVAGSHKNIPHAYYTRAVFPLFELTRISGRGEFAAAAEKFIGWVLALRHPNGWIDEMAFSSNIDPLTHTFAYTYEGLLESANHIAPQTRAEVLETLQSMAERAAAYVESNPQKPLPAFVNSRWEFYGDFSCLVGNAQTALNLKRCAKLFEEPRYLEAAEILLRQVKAAQFFAPAFPEIHGGISGARPIWGGYGSLTLINWAGKFFADALMLK
ncbi:MAG: hypothetical protein Fur002_05410 [Anaerolineales bacterium]